MKILTLFLLLFTYFLSIESDYLLQPINGINGYVQAIEFNLDGNAYVAVLKATEDLESYRQLYKLRSPTEILWVVNITDSVTKIIINSFNNVYLEHTTADNYESYLSVLKEDPVTIKKIDDIYEFSMFIDGDDNIIYNSNEGIKLLRPKSTTPILIKNLENRYFLGDASFATDSKGNLYLGVLDFEGSTASLAVVSNEAKQEEIPYVTAQYFFESEYFVDCLIVNENDEVWVFLSDFTTSQILKLTDGNMMHFQNDELYENHRGLAVKDRVYVISISYNISASAYFLTSSNEVHKISEINGVVAHSFSTIELAADKDGNTYIGAFVAFENGPVALMKPESENTTMITFPRLINVESLVVDDNDDLWVVTGGDGGVYYLKKGETAAVKVLNHRGAATDLIGTAFVNKKTNEVFLPGSTHLYTIVNNTAWLLDF